MDSTGFLALGQNSSTTPPSAQQIAIPSSAGAYQSTHIKVNDQMQQRPRHPRVQIYPITPSTAPSYRRLITVLLPIRYTDKFFKDSVADTSKTALARIALWKDSSTPSAAASSELASGQVVGGIQCRLEDLPSESPVARQLYIQTIAVLSPFRRYGIATSLLDTIVTTIVEYYEGVTSIYAHVWEANVEALEWYQHRGFTIEEGVIEGYYRRLKPSGAKLVRRRIEIADHLAVKKLIEG